MYASYATISVLARIANMDWLANKGWLGQDSQQGLAWMRCILSMRFAFFITAHHVTLQGKISKIACDN
jgi:hypothetical protein